MNYKKLNMIAELKQKKELDKLYRQNTIDLNNYFAYSGKQEVKKKFYFSAAASTGLILFGLIVFS